MTAKEKQADLIKTYLKPTLKLWGYKTVGQNWWKDKGEFYSLLNLQNFSWNTKDAVDFCFNTGVVLKAGMGKSADKNPSASNLTVYLREDFYLPDDRKEHEFRNKSGYVLTDNTNPVDFSSMLKTDFEDYILPGLEKLDTLQESLDSFEN